MVYRDTEIIRKHGGKVPEALSERRVTTSVFFKADSRSYLWVTDRSGRSFPRN